MAPSRPKSKIVKLKVPAADLIRIASRAPKPKKEMTMGANERTVFIEFLKGVNLEHVDYKTLSKATNITDISLLRPLLKHAVTKAISSFDVTDKDMIALAIAKGAGEKYHMLAKDEVNSEFHVDKAAKKQLMAAKDFNAAKLQEISTDTEMKGFLEDVETIAVDTTTTVDKARKPSIIPRVPKPLVNTSEQGGVKRRYSARSLAAAHIPARQHSKTIPPPAARKYLKPHPPSGKFTTPASVVKKPETKPAEDTPVDDDDDDDDNAPTTSAPEHISPHLPSAAITAPASIAQEAQIKLAKETPVDVAPFLASLQAALKKAGSDPASVSPSPYGTPQWPPIPYHPLTGKVRKPRDEIDPLYISEDEYS